MADVLLCLEIYFVFDYIIIQGFFHKKINLVSKLISVKFSQALLNAMGLQPQNIHGAVKHFKEKNTNA